MRKNILIAVCAALTLLSTANVSLAVEVFTVQTELIQYDADLAQKGYVLFSTTAANNIANMVMIDMNGEVVHTISQSGMTGIQYGYLLENGNFLLIGTAANSSTGNKRYIAGGGPGSDIREITWDGDVVWEMDAHDTDWNWCNHHDMRKIYNKKLGQYTYIFLTWEAMSTQDAVNLGVDLSQANALETNNGGNAKGWWSPCAVYEVNQAGEIIWRWSFADHLVTDYASYVSSDFTGEVMGYTFTGATVGDPADYPGKLNINTSHGEPGYVGPFADWTHCNSLDYNPTRGEIVINSKHMSEIYVIDHDNTFVSTTDYDANWTAAASDAGDFLYRFGNPANYGQGDAPGYYDPGDHQFWGAHNIHWVGSGSYYPGWDTLPGEGNFIIFDNSCWNPVAHKSRIIEWNPFIDSTLTDTGDYVNPPDAGYNSGSVTSRTYNYSSQLQWVFEAPYSSFYSMHISGMQRMPNGNTYITAGAQNHYFEVTSDGDVAWEYISPYTSSGAVESVSDGKNSSTYRSYKIPAGHPGLAGKSLIPQGTITNPSSYTGFGFGGAGSTGGGGGGGGAGGGGGGGY